MIVAATSFSILFAYRLLTPAPAYEFKTGVTHPQELSDLIGHGTVVLYFTQNGCPPCDNYMTPKMADLQSQYNGTGVTFITCNFSDHSTPQYKIAQSCGQNYGIRETPVVIVIRGDGAVAKFVGLTDINTVKSAVEDARHGKSSNILPF